MALLQNLKNGLFTTKKSPAVAPVQPIAESSPNLTQSPDTLRQGETYRQWGIRICGIVSGSLQSLPAYLQNVYNYMRREQANDAEIQKGLKDQLNVELTQKNAELTHKTEELASYEDKINAKKDQIKEYKIERTTLLNNKKDINKDQKMKMVIGLIILVPLTIYLFLFYSSTFYSAFFMKAEAATDVMTSMFNPNAIANAWNDGAMELCFILFAPIIFLALGFCLHFFSQQKDNIKYLKMGSILLITFFFDCILAYRIDKLLYELAVITGTAPMGTEFTLEMAIYDINTWTVIFCGFIAYIIWGIVFDMVMSAHQNMDLNRTKVEELDERIKNYEADIVELQNKIDQLAPVIHAIKSKIAEIEVKLTTNVAYNYEAIRTEMTNFFSGWLTQMQVLSCSQADQNAAQNIFNQTIDTFSKHYNSYNHVQ